MGREARAARRSVSEPGKPPHSLQARWQNRPQTGFQTRDGQCYDVDSKGVIHRLGTKAQGKAMRKILDAEAAKSAKDFA